MALSKSKLPDLQLTRRVTPDMQKPAVAHPPFDHQPRHAALPEMKPPLRQPTRRMNTVMVEVNRHLLPGRQSHPQPGPAR